MNNRPVHHQVVYAVSFEVEGKKFIRRLSVFFHLESTGYLYVDIGKGMTIFVRHHAKHEGRPLSL